MNENDELNDTFSPQNSSDDESDNDNIKTAKDDDIKNNKIDKNSLFGLRKRNIKQNDKENDSNFC